MRPIARNLMPKPLHDTDQSAGLSSDLNMRRGISIGLSALQIAQLWAPQVYLQCVPRGYMVSLPYSRCFVVAA